MKLAELLPPEAMNELEELAYELKAEDPRFDPRKDPMDRITLLLTWCVREIVAQRKAKQDGNWLSIAV